MQRLSGLDASFLALETPTTPLHVAGVLVIDSSDAPGGVSFHDVRELLAARLHLAPLARRRLVEVPLGLHHPLWVEDPSFDLDAHLRRVAVPSPGGQRELAELAADIHARPLDRSRPLWELWYVEGLEGGRVALIAKTHHAAVDGVAGVDLSATLLDTGPVPQAPPPAPAWEPDAIPSTVGLLADALVTAVGRQPAAALRAVRHTAEIGLQLRRRTRVDGGGITPPPVPAPRTSLNVPVTRYRSYGLVDLPLDELKAVRRAFGCTVNDVVLALCAGTLGAYLGDRGEAPDRPLVAVCPISVRVVDEHGAFGNRLSTMLVRLRTDVDDPVERLAAIAGSAADGKAQAEVLGAHTLADWAELVAPAVLQRAARLYNAVDGPSLHPPLCNVIASNVPGPQEPLYVAGGRLVAWYPMGPIIDLCGLNITVVSYDGTVHVGVVGCPDTVDDVQAVADGMAAALTDLRKAAEAREAAG